MEPPFQSSFSIRSLLSGTKGFTDEIKIIHPKEEVKPNNNMPSNSSNNSMSEKPAYTYSALITMAIKSSPQKRLTLSDICKWIVNNFPYYQNKSNVWKNSIRHNLSLSSYFIKIHRPVDDPGRGNYWALNPSVEHTTTGETTGRLKSNKENKNYCGNGSLHGKSSLKYSRSYGHHQNSYPYPHLSTKNAIYLPTPEDIRITQQTKQQEAWTNYYHGLNYDQEHFFYSHINGN